MRQKLNKKIMMLTGLLYGLLIGMIVFLYLFRQQLGNYRYLVVALTFLLAFLGSYLLSRYENTVDKKYIEKMVAQGKIALARSGKAERGNVIKSPLRPSNVYYKIDVTVYDHEGNSHEAQLIDLFSIMQDKIPEGNFYVTYDSSDDEMLIVPMGLISMYPLNQPLVEKYEKIIKNLKYLNVYFNKGILIETYEQTNKRLEEDK